MILTIMGVGSFVHCLGIAIIVARVVVFLMICSFL